MYKPMLNISIQAIRKYGNIIIQNFEKIQNFSEYHDEINQKKINQIAEKEVINIISKFYPHHCFLTKNIGNFNENNKSIKWIINPINGIFNYSKGLPHFAISIAVKINERIEIVVVYDPIRNELFYAIKGQNTQLNNRRSRVNKKNTLNKLLISSNVFFCNKKIIIKIFKKILKNNIFICTGSSILDLAYLASGRIDCCLNIGLDIWELNIGELLIREAGGIITDIGGGTEYHNNGNIIAGNINIVRKILLEIKK